MKKDNHEGKKKREKNYRRKEFEKEERIGVQIGKKTVVRLTAKKFYFSF